VLVLGDSTGVGVGCGDPEQTVAGLMAVEFRRAEIGNLCCNGARLADTVAQCEPLAARGDVFDLVLMFVGGNDVIRFRSQRQMAWDARALLAQAKRLSTNVVWMGSANIAGSPLLIPPLSWLMASRTKRTMRRLAHEAQAFGHGTMPLLRLRIEAPTDHGDGRIMRKCHAFNVLGQSVQPTMDVALGFQISATSPVEAA